ncbi:hypothetical protein BE20_13305 [Sorangium cellulosum]|nr:hypothetical protein BE20_13305 [Sorangium cellulosum]
MHYDGERWEAMESSTLDLLFGVWGSGPEDVFAVGVAGTIVHYDGERWQPMARPVQVNLGPVGERAGGRLRRRRERNDIALRRRALGADGLARVRAPARVFAVGESGTILRYDGRRWGPMESPTSARLLAVWGSGPKDVFAVGERGTLLHYDGISWLKLNSTTDRHLLDVWGDGGTSFIVGEGGVIYRHTRMAPP